MQLSPGVVVIAGIAIVVIVVLLRILRRHEAAAPEDAHVPIAPRSVSSMGMRGQGSQTLASWLLDRASEQTGMRLDDDPLARQRITEAAAKAMEEIQARGSAMVNLPFLAADARGPKHFEVRVKRNPDSTFDLD